jgi:hypothetical protein
MALDFLRKLATIGVSEFVLVFFLALSITAVAAVSSQNTNLEQIIAPPPAPEITTILGDEKTKAVLVVGSSLPKAQVRVYAFSTPILIATTADSEGTFFAVFTSDLLPPGLHHFSSTTIFNETQATDPSPKVAVQVASDYTIQAAAGGEIKNVKIGNADANTSQLLRSIIRNQEAAKIVPAASIPRPNLQLRRARLILGTLLVIVVLETVYLLWLRRRRKNSQGQSFWHLGRGFYRLPAASTAHRPGR